MLIDIEALRRDLIEEEYGAFYGGGISDAFGEIEVIQHATSDTLIHIAEIMGKNIRDYMIDE